MRLAMRLCLLPLLAGCASYGGYPYARAPVVPAQAVLLPGVNRDHAFDTVVDVVDDYFEIDREERVKLIGDIETEGRIDTFPTLGATIFEPWRRDSLGLDQRIESTFQTIRRRATVRVIPDQGGYLVDLEVYKELEDADRPEHSTSGQSTFRSDGSLERYREPIGGQPLVRGWIPLGRDVALEQQMIREMYARLAHPGAVPNVRVQAVF